MEQDTNTQTAPEANSPTAAGPTSAELQAKIAELEKQSEGRLRDLQNERAKRQELEARTAPPATASSAQNDATQDELGKVLNPYLAPVMARVKQQEAFIDNTYRDKALEHLASKTGKSKEAVVSDKDLDDKLTSIVKRYGFTGNVYDVTVKACEIMELENLKAQDSERKRSASASASASLPTGMVAAPVVGRKEYSEEDFNAMPLHEYEKLSSSGSWIRNKDGKIVFSPK